MKKLLLILGITTLIVFTGCTKEEKEENLEEITNVITLPTKESQIVELEVSSTKQEEVVKNFTETDDYMNTILLNKNIIESGNSESLKKVLKAVELFQDIEISMKKAGTPALSLKDMKNIKKAVRKLKRDMIVLKSDKDSNINIEEYREMVEKEIIPKLDEAILLLKEAVELNETVIVMTYEENGMNASIEPAHILLIESLLKTTRGALYYMIGYDFTMINITDEENFEINKDFLRVINKEYILKSKMDIKDGVEELLTAIMNLPEADMLIYNKKSLEIEINPNADYKNIENIFAIPTDAKIEAVNLLTQIKEALNGVTTVTLNGVSLKLNLSILFKNDFELIDLYNGIIEKKPSIEDSVETWNDEPLANYKCEGILPDGYKDYIKKSKGETWEEYVDTLFSNSESEEDEFVDFEDEYDIDIFQNLIKKSKKIRNK